MIVTGIDEATIVDTVRKVSELHYGGNLTIKNSATLSPNRARFTLRVRDSSYLGARRAPSGRRTPAACWHAHRDVMRALYGHNAYARIQSAIADYKGCDHFMATFPSTGRVNVGSIMQPCRMQDLCECDNE